VIDESCVSCHGDPKSSAGGLLLRKCDDIGNAQRLLAPRAPRGALAIPCDEQSELLARISGSPGVPLMPPGGQLKDEERQLFRQWILEGAPVPGQPPAKKCSTSR
jgi:hypothetical protein